VATPKAASRPLALTSGDPAGIGPDITIMAWLMRRGRALPPFVLIADPDILAHRADALGRTVAIETVSDLATVPQLFDTHLPVLSQKLTRTSLAGQPDPANASAVIGSIDTAVDLVVAGQAGAVVTNPIAKHVLYDGGFKHPGHTEYLAELAHRRFATPRPRPVMMLASEDVRVVPLTVHIPLRDVANAITADLIITTVRTVAAALETDFGIANARLVVAGLNPHAGEAGTIGKEDEAVVAPAVAALSREGFNVVGPLSADTLFHAQMRATYDAAVTMYHDQALIPIKTLSFDSAVNVTLGLPFVRTSPDHGTAFSLAGSGQASPNSLTAALHMAASMSARRDAVASRNV